MDNRHYTNYTVDATDIWEYECNCFHEKKRDKEQMKELYRFLQDVYLLAKHKPFIEEDDETHYANGYRERYYNRTEDEVTWNFFVCGRKVYDMNSPCEIILTEFNHLEFQRLFILKLQQYCDGLIYTEAFLKHQLRSNFKNNLSAFRKFLDVSLLQYSTAIDGSIIKITNEWFAETKKKKVEKAAKPKSKRRKQEIFSEAEKIDTEVANLDVDNDENAKSKTEKPEPEKNEVEKTFDTEEQLSPELLPTELEPVETIPTGYKIVEGNFTKEEVLQFFSFLYKEKSKEGNTFLLENEVREIFKYGLAIPTEPPAKKYKLNSSLTFPKNIVEFCIYKFYSKYTTSKHKQDVLRFFASYIQDFEKYLKSKTALQHWSNNVKGNRPHRMTFSFSDYLPQGSP